MSVFRLSTDAFFKNGVGPLAVCCTSLVNVLFNTRADKLEAFALLLVGRRMKAAERLQSDCVCI